MIDELPEWAKDAVYLDQDVHFDLKDRLKILFGWTPSFHNGIATEERPGRTQPFTGRIVMLPPSWWPWKPQPMGYMEAGGGEQASEEAPEQMRGL